MDNHDIAACWEANADTWTRQARAGYDVYRDLVNTPAFLAMLPPVSGLAGLDIGCGEGGNTRHVAKLGARMAAVDLSTAFIRHAREAEAASPLGIEFAVADAHALPFTDASFDFAVAFMVMMDVADPARVLLEAKRVLRKNGFFQFSILHPCFAPPHRRVIRDAENKALAVEIADYFSVGRHLDEWWFGGTSEEERARVAPFRVPYVHLTLSGWFDAIRGAGLVVERLGEPTATMETVRAVPRLDETRVAPLFLHVLTRKI